MQLFIYLHTHETFLSHIRFHSIIRIDIVIAEHFTTSSLTDYTGDNNTVLVIICVRKLSHNWSLHAAIKMYGFNVQSSNANFHRVTSVVGKVAFQ